MNPTNVDEFLRVCEGKLVPYRRHDCLFARVEIFRHHGEQIYRLLSGQGNGNEGIPLGCVASDEDEPLPPKREDILFAGSFCFSDRWRWQRRRALRDDSNSREPAAFST